MAGNKTLTVTVRINADGTQSVQEIKKVDRSFSGLAKSIKANALKITAVLATVVVGFQKIRAAGNLDAQTEALKRNLALQGVEFDAFIGKLKEVSDAQISTANLIQSSSRALLLGIPAEQIADLLEIARARAIALGVDVAQAFDDLTVGLARRSIPILDNLGFTTRDLQKAQEDFAASIGKTTEQLTAQEQSTALLNGILTQGAADIKVYGDAQNAVAAGTNQLTAQLSNLGTFLGKLGLALTGAVVSGLAAFATKLLDVAVIVATVNQKIGELGSNLPLVGRAFERLRDDATKGLETFTSLRDRVEDFGTKLADSTTVMLKAAFGLDKTEKAAKRAASAIQSTGTAAEDAGEKIEDFAESTGTADQALQALTSDSGGARSALDAIAASAGAAAQRVEELGRRVDIFNEQGQRTGSRLTAPAGDAGLFPGLSGAVYTYTTRRSVPTENGGVRFVSNAARGRRII